MPNNYVLLETIALTQSAASVTFDNLPTSGYTDLKIVVSARTDNANNTIYLGTEFNGVTTGYTARDLYGTGSAAASRVPTGSLSPVIPGSTSTANTFSNMEIYIPNYRSSNFKSYSADSVTENNATLAFQALSAMLWSNTAAITSIKLTPELGSLIAGSTFSLYGVAALGTTPVLAPKATGGNIVANDGTFWYHAFTSSGYFVPQVGLTADVLVVAGGGGGGYDAAGGGGAGGVIYKASVAAATTAEAITVGAGATGATSGAINATGTNSTGFGLSAFGGGGGGTGNGTGYSGGSSGGGGWGKAAGTPTQTSNNGGTGYGNTGGNGGTNNYPGGGGGGAGAAAANCTTNAATAGGAGLNTWSSWLSATGLGVSGYIAGGGGGGAVDAYRATGGAGGGGNGAQQAYYLSPANIAGSDAVANTGSGGGGGGGSISPSRQAGYNGGSGLVIVRYPIN